MVIEVSFSVYDHSIWNSRWWVEKILFHMPLFRIFGSKKILQVYNCQPMLSCVSELFQNPLQFTKLILVCFMIYDCWPSEQHLLIESIHLSNSAFLKTISQLETKTQHKHQQQCTFHSTNNSLNILQRISLLYHNKFTFQIFTVFFSLLSNITNRNSKRRYLYFFILCAKFINRIINFYQVQATSKFYKNQLKIKRESNNKTQNK